MRTSYLSYYLRSSVMTWSLKATFAERKSLVVLDRMIMRNGTMERGFL